MEVFGRNPSQTQQVAQCKLFIKCGVEVSTAYRCKAGAFSLRDEREPSGCGFVSSRARDLPSSPFIPHRIHNLKTPYKHHGEYSAQWKSRARALR